MNEDDTAHCGTCMAPVGTPHQIRCPQADEQDELYRLKGEVTRLREENAQLRTFAMLGIAPW